VRLHASTGLVAGPLLVVLGLSGAALVFRPELDELLTPSPRLAATATMPSLDAVRRAALLPHPGAQAYAVRVPADVGRPYRVEIAQGEQQRLDVDVDPATLHVVSSRAPERSALAAVYALHAAFHGGRLGALLVALLGLWLVVEGISGLWLYGPSVTPRAGARRHRSSRSVHRVLGAASLLAGVLLGLTGAFLGLGSALVPASATAAASMPAGLEHLDAVVARVMGVSPGAQIAAIRAEPLGVVRVDLRDAATIRIDGTTGVVTVSGTTPSAAWDVIRRLHAGDFPGRFVRVVYAAIGLALAVLAMTGFVIAARRQSSKVLT
jgi:uncharacterized iron-regulated membrane protein